MSRVALIGENSIEYINTLLDIWNQGNCAVLIDWRIPSETAQKMMLEANVNICFIEDKIYINFENKINKNCNIEYIPFSISNNCLSLLPNIIYDKFKFNYSDNEAVVIYSSGTTGTSKGVILSHYAINTNADLIIDYMKPDDIDCIYVVKNIAHSSTLVGEILVALKTRIRLLISPVVVPPRVVLNNILHFKVTILCLNPILAKMYAIEYQKKYYNISCLKVIYISGSMLNEKTHKFVCNTFKDLKVYNVYGLSEAGPRVSAQTSECCTDNSVGRAINGVSIIIVDSNGKRLDNYEVGIIYVKTPCLFNGYITGDIKYKSLYPEWLNTGDMGYIDQNDELHIVSRVDDVIIINSHKIYSYDIENEILENKNIRECIVVKFEKDGHEVVGCLYSSSIDNTEDIIEIKKRLSSKLINYEIPEYFIKCSNIPYNQNGKPDKNKSIETILKYINKS